MNQKTYENGFRLVHEKSSVPSSIASIQVFCDIGSIHEPDESRGSAHFIEHMCFKGTTRLKTSKEVNLIFDKTGSESNAYTDRRYTCYYADTDKDNARLCISTLADMLLNSVFDKEGKDWIDWYLYERIGFTHKVNLATDSDGKEICYDIPSLWEEVKNNLLVK